MDVHKMLTELRQERDNLNEIILSLERLSLGQGKKRGRPPKWRKELEAQGSEEAVNKAPKKAHAVSEDDD